MAKTKLFISHSSHSDEAKGRLGRLEVALTAEGYDVLVDERFIESGDQWREKIHAALAQCHAGLILFDEQALESPWVLKEATILGWRNEREQPDFKLVPVRLGSVSDAGLEKKEFAPLLLSETQYIASKEVADIVAEVTKVVPKGLETQTLFDLLTDEIADQVEQLSGNRTIAQVAERRFPDLEFTAGVAQNRIFADRLAHEIFRSGAGCLSEAVEILDEFGLSQNSVAAERIIKVLSPMWVEPDAAVVLVERRSHAFALCCIKLEVFQDFTAQKYIERGHPRSAQWQAFNVDEVHDGDRVNHVREQVREGINARFTAAQFHDKGEFAYLRGKLGEPGYVLIPWLLDEVELKDLEDVTSHLTFVMFAEDCDHRPQLKGARYLEPKLGREDEIAALTGRDKANEFLKKLTG